MPIPKPKQGEKKDDFIQRCMGDSTMNKDFPDNDQRFAVCNQQIKESSTEKEKTYSDYPQAATNNAKRCLAWVEKNGWGSCGTDVGKQRAHQLANREPLTRDTIARMASFKRHQQNKDVPYGEGCGGLMWDAWGGDAGIEWAIRKLQQIKDAEYQVAINKAVDMLISKFNAFNIVVEHTKREK